MEAKEWLMAIGLSALVFVSMLNMFNAGRNSFFARAITMDKPKPNTFYQDVPGSENAK